jgi:hypothetical protein
VIIILGHGKRVFFLEKGKHIIKMVLWNMKVIFLMINMKEMENIFMKMMIII